MKRGLTGHYVPTPSAAGEKFPRLVAELVAQLAESAKLEKAIRQNLQSLRI